MTENEKNMYKCLDNYMVRTPLLPYNLYFDICNSKERVIKKFLADSKIQEAILVSSNSLYESALIVDTVDKKDKKFKQIQSALIKYMIRMSTRTTPYGLFAGVSIGNFNDYTSVNSIDFKNEFKHIRIDMEWEFKLLKEIENDDNIFNNLKLYPSETVFRNGNRLENVYVSNYGTTNKSDLKFNASILLTNKVNDVLNFSKNGIKVKNLIDLLNPNGNYDNEIIFKFIRELVRNEYLITDLRPPLVNTSSTEYILNKLETIDEAKTIYKQLNEVNSMMKKYNETEIGSGIELYKDIISKMKEICECENYLQVDLKKSDNICSLNKYVKKDIEKLVEVLVKISVFSNQSAHLKSLANDFNEKYGADREVNILEVLDRDRGIGAPAGYSMPPSNKILDTEIDTPADVRYDEVLAAKVNKFINNNESEILLEDVDLDYILGDSTDLLQKSNLPNSLDINIFIKSKDPKSIDDGNYELFIGPNYGSQCAGKMFGRFAYMFDNNLSNIFSKIDESIKKTEDEAILVEVAELPMGGRSANICKSNHIREYELSIATNNSTKSKRIGIQDVYVGVDDENKFYFKSKKLNKRLIFTSNNMLNNFLCSNVYRFMLDVCENSKCDNIFERVHNIGLKSLIKIPRIKYKNLVISSAKWKVNKNILNITKDEHQNLLNLKTFVNDNKIPKYVYVGNNDNRIILNMENDVHLIELLDMIKKLDDYTILSELEFSEDEIWVKDDNGNSYISELVFPLVLDIDSNSINQQFPIITKSNIAKNNSMIDTYSKERVSGLLDEWIYFKFYGTDKRIDEFLGVELPNLVELLYKNNVIDKFFFIRYSDPDNHIRFRVKLSNGEKNLNLLNLMNEFIKNQINKGLMSKANIDMYFKEIERYGGIKSFEMVEQVFCDDSLISMNLIALIKSKEIKMDDILLACINTVHIMESFGIEFSDQNTLFQLLFNQKDNRDLYREKSKDLIFYCNSYNNWENLRSTEEGQKIYEIIKLREISFNKYWERVNLEDSKGNLANDKIDILMSSIHMFCNRFLSSRDKELITMQLVRHTLHALKYKRKQLNEATNEY